jgi:hypothetical protein
LHEPNTKKGKGSPAELQQKAIGRELKKREQGVAEGYTINENSDVLAGLTDILKIAASKQTPQNPQYFARQVKDISLQLKDNPATQKMSNYLDSVVRWADVISSGKEKYSLEFANEVYNVLGPATRAYQDALLNKQGVAEVSKATIDRYVSKASDAHGDADFKARMSKNDPDKRSYHVDQKKTAEKRRQGISRALDRMSREESVGEAKRPDRAMPTTDLRVGDRVVADTSKENYPGGHKQRVGIVTRVGQKGVHIRTDDNDEPEWHPYKIVKKQDMAEARQSAAVKLAKAWDQQQAKSAASRERAKELLNPAKKEEPKKEQGK